MGAIGLHKQVPRVQRETVPCISFKDWTGDRSVFTMGTNAGSSPLPFQRWRNFKEAFAPELVERAVSETAGEVKHILDPFGGSGTTALAAQFLGIRPTTIEVNPYLADLIEAKLAEYDTNRLGKTLAQVISRVRMDCSGSHDLSRLAGLPKTFIQPGVDDRYLFSKVVARRLLSYRDAIDQLPGTEERRLLRVILGSIAISVSNVIVSGKGRRYRKDWCHRQATADETDDLFRERAMQAIYDLRRYESRACRKYSVLRGDSRILISETKDVDLCVFSPPYPNSFDYTDVYNVELWMLGYLDGAAANFALRNSTLRSHVQIARNMGSRKIPSQILDDTLARLHDVREKLWNSNIPRMISAYFSDLADILKSLYSIMRTAGRVYVIVGDSRYAGVNIPVATILSDISPEIGFSVRNIEAFRSMRVSPQQGGQKGLSESLVILQKN